VDGAARRRRREKRLPTNEKKPTLQGIWGSKHKIHVDRGEIVPRQAVGSLVDIKYHVETRGRDDRDRGEIEIVAKSEADGLIDAECNVEILNCRTARPLAKVI